MEQASQLTEEQCVWRGLTHGLDEGECGVVERGLLALYILDTWPARSQLKPP